MRTTLILAAATAVLLAAPAFAEDQTAVQPTQPTTDNPMMCKTEQAATGSRIGVRKICMTRSEWQAQEQGDRSTVDQAQSSSLRAAMPGN